MGCHLCRGNNSQTSDFYEREPYGLNGKNRRKMVHDMENPRPNDFLVLPSQLAQSHKYGRDIDMGK